MHNHNLQLNFLLFVIQAVASFIQLEPMMVTVLRDSTVQFNCSTNESWDVMTWLLDERTILSISVQHGPLGSDKIVSTVNHSTSALSVWELILNAPFKTTAQQVRCEFLPTKASRPSSAVFVQERGNVSIFEGDLTAYEGTLVIFHCKAIGWYPNPRVSWVVSNISVDKSNFNTSELQDTSGLFHSISVLQIIAEISTTIECQVSVSLTHQARSVHLTVVAPNTQDYMVVIAVTVKVFTVILLVTLVLILCYKQKFIKPSSKDTFSSSLWTVNLSGIRTSVAEETRGKVNQGYHAEDVTGSGHSDLLNRADSMTNITSPPQYTFQNQITQGDSNLQSKKMKTVRRVTTV